MPAQQADTTPAGATVGELLHSRRCEAPEREMLRFPGESLTRSDVDDRSTRLAHVLRSRGVRVGDRVAVMMANIPEFPIAWMAIAKLGAVMVPINASYRRHDLLHTLTDSGVQVALADAHSVDLLRSVSPLCPGLTEVTTLSALMPEIRAASSKAPRVEIDSTALIGLQYTSGTTGFPKGCMLSHDYFLRLGSVLVDHVSLTDRDVVLTAQPFSYIDPQWSTLMTLMAGCPLVVLPRFSASTYWRSVVEHRASFLYTIGTMPVYLMKQEQHPLDARHEVRLVLCSGIPASLHADFEARWQVPWREAFGMTETGADLAVPVDDATSVGSGAVGVPLPGKDAFVCRPDGTEAGVGEVGELVVSGHPMMQGYWNQPAATAQTVRADGLHTGDLARRDDRGYFYLAGRLKDMIRRTGENIAAAEVEQVLCQHPLIQAAAVVPVPDEVRGEEVKAFVQLVPHAELAPQEIIHWTRARLAHFKAPRYVQYVTDFPMTPSERIAKHVLVEQYVDATHDVFDAARTTSR